MVWGRLPLLFLLFLLLRSHKFIKNKNRAGEGVDPLKLKPRGEPRKEEYFVHGTFPSFVPKKEGEKSNFEGDKKRRGLLLGDDAYFCGYIYFFIRKNMAENVLESGPPSAKRPKLSSPALSASASDGNGKYAFYFILQITKDRIIYDV